MVNMNFSGDWEAAARIYRERFINATTEADMEEALQNGLIAERMIELQITYKISLTPDGFI